MAQKGRGACQHGVTRPPNAGTKGPGPTRGVHAGAAGAPHSHTPSSLSAFPLLKSPIIMKSATATCLLASAACVSAMAPRAVTAGDIYVKVGSCTGQLGAAPYFWASAHRDEDEGRSKDLYVCEHTWWHKLN